MANINQNLASIGQGQIAPQLQAQRAGVTGKGQPNPMQAQAVPLPGPNSKWEWLKQQILGRPAENLLFPNYYPNQQQGFDWALQQGMQGLQPGNISFGPIEDQARRDFSQKTIPGIAERFTAFGGGQQSGPFAQILGSAASDLETNLAAMRSQYGMNQQDLMLRLLGIGLTPQFENVLSPREKGKYEQGGENLFKLLGVGAKAYGLGS